MLFTEIQIGHPIRSQERAVVISNSVIAPRGACQQGLVGYSAPQRRVSPLVLHLLHHAHPQQVHVALLRRRHHRP
uniref:Uncharacterized protein n=1 Tax=Arundo donax TaxID=35708 RepID=A0A0A9B8W8_ARUDO